MFRVPQPGVSHSNAHLRAAYVLMAAAGLMIVTLVSIVIISYNLQCRCPPRVGIELPR